jgi:hypothetical protein
MGGYSEAKPVSRPHRILRALDGGVSSDLNNRSCETIFLDQVINNLLQSNIQKRSFNFDIPAVHRGGGALSRLNSQAE